MAGSTAPMDKPKLTREQIKRIRDAAERNVRLWTLDDVIKLCDLALRALPLPEGETAVSAAVFAGGQPIAAPCDIEGCYYAKYLETRDILSRQAAVERDKSQEVEALQREFSERLSHMMARAEAAEASLASAREVIARTEAEHADEFGRGNCYYCGEPCVPIAADPGMWPVGLCHADDPGVVKPHHEHCVMERLESLASARREALEEGIRRITDGSIFRDEGSEKAADALRELIAYPRQEGREA